MFLKDLKKSAGLHSFGVYAEKRFMLLTVKNKDVLVSIRDNAKSEEWNLLDANLLQNLILDKSLGIKNPVKGDNINFTRWVDKAIELIDQGKYQLAIFLNPTKISEVKSIANAREKMPQKSTHFYPKLLSGLVMYKF